MRHEDFIKGVNKNAAKAIRADVVQPKVTQARIIYDDNSDNPGWFVRYTLSDGQILDTSYGMPDDPEYPENDLYDAADDALFYEGYSHDDVIYEIVGGNPGEGDPDPEGVFPDDILD